MIWEKSAIDIGISLAVFSSLGLAASILYVIFGSVLLAPHLVVPSGIYMFISFLLGIVLGGFEADYRKKKLQIMDMTSPANGVSMSETSAIPYQIPLWLRKADSPPGTEVK